MKSARENDIILADTPHFLPVCATDDFLYPQGLLGYVGIDTPSSIK